MRAVGRPGALRLMAVHAHPDDESSKGAATLARYVRAGAHVLVVTCTGGERGGILNPAVRPPDRLDMAAVRRREMARARDILGVDQLFLGFVDSGLPEGDPASLPAGCFAAQPVDTAAAALVRVVREFRPHVLLTYDESGGYPHPDHVMCHRISVAAFDAAGDPAVRAGLGGPWQPLKLYYHVGFHPGLANAFRAALRLPRAGESIDERHGYWRERQRHDPWPGLAVTTRIRCGDYFEVRDRALLAHTTQVDPNGFWFVCPPDVQRAVWPTEDYHLARTLVPTALPEHDLFAGVRDPRAAALPLPARTEVGT